MKTKKKICLGVIILSLHLIMFGWCLEPQSAFAAMPGFDVNKISDMSDFDPNNPVIPTGDTIRIGLLEAFSGASAKYGEQVWLLFNWVAHDLNKRGGILVDGKKKKIQIIKGDTKGKAAEAKKAAERLVLKDKVHVLTGGSGSHLVLTIQTVAKKYKKIYMNYWGLSDSLMDGKNFNRYTFRPQLTTKTIGDAFAKYYAERPENNFYILCQDYSYGHNLGEAFKKGLEKYKPDSKIVGEDYHGLILKDFAPYLTKIKASGAEVVFTGDWAPDSENLLKQARQMEIMVPFANVFMAEPDLLASVGPEGSSGLVSIHPFIISDKNSEQKKFLTIWNNQWNRWGKPYNTALYKWPTTDNGAIMTWGYWLLSVIEKAGSLDPEKIIQTWEGNEWNSLVGVLKMRACDHQTVQNVYFGVTTYPNRYFKTNAWFEKAEVVPDVAPPIAGDLDRCK